MEHGALHQREDRSDFKRGSRRIERRTEPVAGDRDGVGSGKILIDESRVTGVHRVGDHQIDRRQDVGVVFRRSIVSECQADRRFECVDQLRG